MALNHGFLQQFTQEPSLTVQMGLPSQETGLQGTEAPSNELSFKNVKYTDPEEWDFEHYKELWEIQGDMGEWMILREGW